MNTNFSPNMIKTYQSCPKKYYFQYVENINVPKSSLPFEKGKKIHALANYYLQKIKIDRIETALTPQEREIWELLKANPFYNMDYLKSEFTLNISLTPHPTLSDTAYSLTQLVPRRFELVSPKGRGKNSYWLGGRLDAIVHNGDDYYILDYKTGSVPQNPEFDPQTMIYLLCADRYLKDYHSLSFVYIDLKNKQNYVVQFNEQLKERYEKELINICNVINTDTAYQCNAASCRYCEYNKHCILK